MLECSLFYDRKRVINYYRNRMEKKVAKTKKVVSKDVVVAAPDTRRTVQGKVISNKMQKTVKVLVETKTMHPVYKKVMNKRKVYFAHTEKELNEGEMVTIKESRPYSKNVKWVVVEK